MEELQPFVERPTDPQVSLSISEASFAWDKVHKWDQNTEKYSIEIPATAQWGHQWTTS